MPAQSLRFSRSAYCRCDAVEVSNDQAQKEYRDGSSLMATHSNFSVSFTRCEEASRFRITTMHASAPHGGLRKARRGQRGSIVCTAPRPPD